MKISTYTLGCKLNQAESDQFALELANQGHQVISNILDAEVVIFNTCAVTESAVRKSRQAIHKVKNQNTKCLVVATGCSLEQEKEVDLFVSDKENLVSQVLHFLEERGRLVSEEAPVKADSDKVKAMIKIQDGCDNFCNYCLISRRRGPLRSFDPEVIIEQINEIEKQNHYEVFLTGVNINKYDFEGKIGLEKLIEIILEKTSIPRIRLGSIDPNLVTDELISLWKNNSRLCRHWHLSLQSGSNKILEAMNRHYSRKQYLKIVQKLRSLDPFFSITTDVIVGFPGETEQNFEDTLDLMNEARFAKVHIFPFSKRPGTPAEKMTNQVPEEIKEARAQKARETEASVSNAFKKENVGREEEVLFEGERNGYFEGHSKNYLRVFQRSEQNLQNRLIKVKLDQENLRLE
ncbi:tRNA (N(6)-L-threonylcarbamoyladenosine(37)-C(2))-methylthiotransferase MtaB [Patescibacteria group bacterium]|nr:tRNA (N(6)-L-threonylcarbamoyladenosine(37)-C(2))-methylthiotransferase MtaB [Patescibacteria group bacterium]